MNTLLKKKFARNDEIYGVRYSYTEEDDEEYEEDEDYPEYLAPASSISLMCFPISVTAVCCVSRDNNTTASLKLSKAVLTAEQTKQYQTPWEKQQKKLTKKRNRHVCLCWCCMCTCMCNPVKNRVRRRVSSNMEKRATCYKQLFEITRPTAEQIKNWSTSFESILEDEVGVNIFEFFLQQEHSEENIRFWLDVHKLRRIENNEDRKAKMRKIYLEYLKPMAAKEINIAGTTRRKIEEDLQNDPLDNVFDAAQTQVFLLMHRQSYPRFLTSDLFNAAIQSAYAYSAKAAKSSKSSTITAVK